MSNFFEDISFASKPPIKRAAYSDRTAWILAELSRLVYEKLPAEMSIDSLAAQIEAAVEKGDTKNFLSGLIQKHLKQGGTIKSEVQDVLSTAGFTYVNSYAVEGTEALLCKLNLNSAKLNQNSKDDGMLILAFRGTQPNIKDVFTDIKATLVNADESGRIHEGFKEAYKKIAKLIEDDLKKHSNLPVYTTGHSLGGALAMVATRYLASDSLGATYTYGSPRVADSEFYKDIRTPVYRVVNAADAVPRIPFGHGFNLFTRLIRLIPINGTRAVVEWLEKKFQGYTHYGNLVFLNAPPNEKDSDGMGYKGLQVIKSPSIFVVAQIVIKRYLATRFKAGVMDHSMQEYSDKLYVYAKRRNL